MTSSEVDILAIVCLKLSDQIDTIRYMAFKSFYFKLCFSKSCRFCLINRKIFFFVEVENKKEDKLILGVSICLQICKLITLI